MPYCYWRSTQWRSLHAYLELEQRINALCDKLLHPDLRIAGDAASELSSVMHAASHPNPAPHLYYALDEDVAAYVALAGEDGRGHVRELLELSHVASGETCGSFECSECRGVWWEEC